MSVCTQFRLSLFMICAARRFLGILCMLQCLWIWAEMLYLKIPRCVSQQQVQLLSKTLLTQFWICQKIYKIKKENIISELTEFELQISKQNLIPFFSVFLQLSSTKPTIFQQNILKKILTFCLRIFLYIFLQRKC